MKNLLIIALLLTATTFITAQNLITWEGGTPGKECKWDEPRNWSTNNVPDEFSFVIIKNLNTGHGAQPIINVVAKAANLEIQSGAYLTITKKGVLELEGDLEKYGIEFHGGELFNKGNIVLKNIDLASAEKTTTNTSGDSTKDATPEQSNQSLEIGTH